MNTTKNISLIGLMILFVVSSCTMEKRVHRPGYHTEWLTIKHKRYNKKNKNRSLHVSKQKDKSEKLDQTTVKVSERATIALDQHEENKVNTNVRIDNTVTTVDNTQVFLPKKTKNVRLSKHVKTINEVKEVKPVAKSRSKKDEKIIQSGLGEEPGYSGMAIAGFVCGFLGLLLVLITGWPFLLGTLGTIFSAIGLGQTSRGQRGKGYAIAGLATGLLAIAIFWIWVAIIASI